MTPYQRGIALEYKIKKLLEHEGWTVLRTAGSHGEYDLIAYKNREVIFIQLKRKAEGKSSVVELNSYDATVTEILWTVADKAKKAKQNGRKPKKISPET